jgi:hypothetical protein
MSGYCPAGKCECENFDNGNNENRLFCHAVDLPLDVYLIEVCPYPSRQQVVGPQKMYGAMDIAFAAGRAEGIREARETLSKMAEEYIDGSHSRHMVVACIAKLNALEVKP